MDKERIKEMCGYMSSIVKKHEPVLCSPINLVLLGCELTLGSKRCQWRKAGLTDEEIEVLSEYYKIKFLQSALSETKEESQ